MKTLNVLIIIAVSVVALGQSLVYEGTLLDSNGATISESGVKLKVEIFDDALTCILYEREFTLDLSAANGHFSLDLSAGAAPSGQPHTSNTLSQVLSNANGNNVTCANSSVRSFTGTFVKRQIRISILEVNAIDVADVQMPTQDLDLIPFANEAETSKLFTGTLSGDVTGVSSTTTVAKIQGTAVATTTPTGGQVLKYDSGAGKYIPVAIDSSMISNNSVSVDDVNFASSNGINVPTLTAAPGAPAAGQIYYNSVNNKIYFYNGSGWIDTGAGGGDFLANGSVAMSGNIKLNGKYLSGDGGNEGVFVNSTGNVGIGTAAPKSALQVSGYTQFDIVTGAPPSADCDSADEYGRSKVDAAAGAVYVCMASGWMNTSGGGGGSSIPSGFVQASAMTSCPSGWLAANGSAVSRTTYSDLFSAIGVIYGNGDGSTTFNLPDYRGQFLRGLDGSSGNDPDSAIRADRGDGTTGDNVGTKQVDGFKSHTHANTGGLVKVPTNGNQAYFPGSAANATGAAGGNETRPKNIYVLYCIKN